MSEPRRIRPPREHEKLIDKLIDSGVFDSKQSSMMFAAALGKRFATRETLGTPGDGIRWYIFEKAGDDAFVNALALVDKSDINILDPNAESGEDVQTIFEEYAAGGYRYMKQHILDEPGDFVENALAIVQRYHKALQPSPTGLEGIDRSTLELLGEFE